MLDFKTTTTTTSNTASKIEEFQDKVERNLSNKI